jgi:hypothetical protein
MKNILLVSIIVCFVVACTQQKEKGNMENYSIKIDYLNIPRLDTRKMHNDSLLIVFHGYFEADTISVMINQKHFRDLILTTDDATGWSGDIQTIKYKDIESVGIRINGGNLIYIEPPVRQYNIQVLYLDSTATVSFHRKLPV